MLADVLDTLHALVGTINDGDFHGHRSRTLQLLSAGGNFNHVAGAASIICRVRRLPAAEAVLAAAGFNPAMRIPGRLREDVKDLSGPWLADWSILYKIDPNLTLEENSK